MIANWAWIWSEVDESTSPKPFRGREVSSPRVLGTFAHRCQRRPIQHGRFPDGRFPRRPLRTAGGAKRSASHLLQPDHSQHVEHRCFGRSRLGRVREHINCSSITDLVGSTAGSSTNSDLTAVFSHWSSSRLSDRRGSRGQATCLTCLTDRQAADQPVRLTTQDNDRNTSPRAPTCAPGIKTPSMPSLRNSTLGHAEGGITPEVTTSRRILGYRSPGEVYAELCAEVDALAP
jgi:hypothetical protein